MRSLSTLAALTTLLVFSLPAYGDQSQTGQVSPQAITVGGGYGVLFALPGDDPDAPATVTSAAFSLEAALRIHGSHQIALRTDILHAADPPASYTAIMARHAGLTYGRLVTVGDIQFQGTAGPVFGIRRISEFYRDPKTHREPVVHVDSSFGLIATIGAQWKPLSFLAFGIEAVGSSVLMNVTGLVTVEIGMPPDY